jgi:hypothetical protein
MNTKTIAIVIGVIVVLGAGYYFYSNSPTYSNNSTTGTNPLYQGTDTTKPATGTTHPSSVVSATGKFTGTMAQLASRGGAYKCTFDASTAAAQSTGTTYVSDGKVRTDFKTVAGGVPVQSHMIQTGGYIYMWTTIAPTGVKIKVGPVDSTPAGQNAQYNAANASYTYDCQGWTADVSEFQFPSGVTFTSVN